MPETKDQLLRLIKLVSMLKTAEPYQAINCATFAKWLSDETKERITCTARTIERDIEFLKEELGAPITYDANAQGHYLTDQSWQMGCPKKMSKEMMDLTMVGAHLVESIVPEPMKTTIRDTLDQHVAANYAPHLLEEAFLESLLFTTGLKAEIAPETFKSVFDAWRTRNVITFVYHTPNQEPSQRRFEPHVVSFHSNGLWYTKGYTLPDRKVTVYAIHRMSDVVSTGIGFDIDAKLVEDVTNNGLFGFPVRDDIKVYCDKSIAFYLREHQGAKKLKVEPQPDGGVIVTLSRASEYDTLRWVLGEAGKIRILEPDSLRQQLLDAARKVIERNA